MPDELTSNLEYWGGPRDGEPLPWNLKAGEVIFTNHRGFYRVELRKDKRTISAVWHDHDEE